MPSDKETTCLKCVLTVTSVTNVMVDAEKRHMCISVKLLTLTQFFKLLNYSHKNIILY